MNLKVLTTSEVGETLRLSLPLIRTLIQRGDLKGVKAGRNYRVAESAVVDYLRGSGGNGRKTEKARETAT
jgi:excisionase family DNA binding protein